MADKELKVSFAKSKEGKAADQFKEQGTTFMGSIYMKHDQLEKLGNPTELNVIVTPKS